jgi:membrane-associated phospholipid phosphatase
LKKNILVLLIALWFTTLKAQRFDTLIRPTVASQNLPTYSTLKSNTNQKTFLRKQMIIPAAFISYGLTSLISKNLKDLNNDFQEDIWIKRPHSLNHIDNYLQISPAVSVYALNLVGIKGKNNFRDRTLIYLLSNVITTAIVFPTKKITSRLRPDSSSYTSFPSGHTAEAFASAEFMRMEYKDVSFWYGVAGYIMAGTTGYLRMYNNKHWFSDVVAGAGIGIASTKISFWLYPKIRRLLFKNKPAKTVWMPIYQNGTAGISIVHAFY